MAGDSSQDEEEEPDTGRSGEQHGNPHGQGSGAPDAQDGLVNPALEGAHVGHQHDGDVGMADAEGIKFATRGINARSEEGFVGLDAEVAQECQSAEKKNGAKDT